MTRYILPAIFIGCMFLFPISGMAAGDEKAEGGKANVEQVRTIDQLRADLRDTELKYQGCQYEKEQHVKALQAVGKEQDAARKRYEEIKKEIAEREVKKGEKK